MKQSDMKVDELYVTEMGGAFIRGTGEDGRQVAMTVKVPSLLMAKGLNEMGDEVPGGRYVRVMQQGAAGPHVMSARKVVGPWSSMHLHQIREAELAGVVQGLNRALTDTRKLRAERLAESAESVLRQLGFEVVNHYGGRCFDIGNNEELFADRFFTQQVLIALGFIEDEDALAASIDEAEGQKAKGLTALARYRAECKGEEWG